MARRTIAATGRRATRRDAVLAGFGIETVRVRAADVLGNLEGVVQAIVAQAEMRSQS